MINSIREYQPVSKKMFAYFRDNSLFKRHGMLIPVMSVGMFNKTHYIRSVCDCGNLTDAVLNNVRSGLIVSCGCYLAQRRLGGRNIRYTNESHPFRSNILSVREGMIYRCRDSSNDRYGGRGIEVCEDWMNSTNIFYKWAISNGYQVGLQIDRIDNDGNYEPSNCRFVDAKTNCGNRSDNRRVVLDGVSMIDTVASTTLGMNRNYIGMIRRGLSANPFPHRLVIIKYHKIV